MLAIIGTLAFNFQVVMPLLVTLTFDSSAGKYTLLFSVMTLVFIAGFMLEPLVIILMVAPIVTPLIVNVGFDREWFCVLFLVMLQTGYLTPPMAPSIFYLRGIAPPEIKLHHMYTGIWPFIGLQLLVVGLLVLWSDCSSSFPNASPGCRMPC